MPKNYFLCEIIPFYQWLDADITIDLSLGLIGYPKKVQKYIFESNDWYHHTRINILYDDPMNLLRYHSQYNIW